MKRSPLIFILALFAAPAVYAATQCSSTALGNSAVCVQSAYGAGSTSVSVAFGSNNTATNTILVFIWCNIATTCSPSVSDSRNTYPGTPTKTCLNLTSKDLYLFEADNIGAGANTVVVSATGNSNNNTEAIVA
jgi:hypothetical protein